MYIAAIGTIGLFLYGAGNGLGFIDWSTSKRNDVAKIWNFAVSGDGLIITGGVLALIVLSTVLVDSKLETHRKTVWGKRKRVLESRRRDIRAGLAVATRSHPVPTHGPAPNISCLGDVDLFVELDQEQVFRESDLESCTLRAVAVKFCNEPKVSGKEKVGSTEKVRAQIIFYEPDWPDRERYRVDHACWLNEKSPYVSFSLDAVQYLIVGVFSFSPTENGFKDFTIYGNSRDKSVSQPLMGMSSFLKYTVKVRLIVGEHGEFSSDHDFELDGQGNAYSFGYVTEQEKEKRKDSQLNEIAKLVAEGCEFFNVPLIDTNWDGFYLDAHRWRARVSAMIRRFYGLALSSRFDSATPKRRYPHWLPIGRDGFLSELYTQFVNLQDIALELGAPFTRIDELSLKRTVALKRLEQLVIDLSDFSQRADALIDCAVNNRTIVPGDIEFGMRKWEGEVYTYLENYLDKEEAIQFVSDKTMEKFELPDGSPGKYQSYMLDQTHTRLVRLKRLVREMKRGYDEVCKQLKDSEV